MIKLLQMLGHPCDVTHEPYREDHWILNHPNIFITRDPRNILISMLRMRRQFICEGSIIALMKRFDTKPFVEALAEYAPWLDHAGLVIQYEYLRGDPQSVDTICTYLQQPSPSSDVWTNLPGTTFSWNDIPSDFTLWWTSRVQEMWEHYHGPAVLKQWGYQ